MLNAVKIMKVRATITIEYDLNLHKFWAQSSKKDILIDEKEYLLRLADEENKLPTKAIVIDAKVKEVK